MSNMREKEVLTVHRWTDRLFTLTTTQELLDGRIRLSGRLIELLRRASRSAGSNSECPSKPSRSDAGLIDAAPRLV